MRRIDYHIHTRFSFDGNENPEDMIEEAINNNLEEICFTDHQDFGYPIDDFNIDIDAYTKYIKQIKEDYKDKISIKYGIEIGLDLNHEEEINRFIKCHDFDFVIGSIHVINNTEFYYGEYFKNKSKEEAHKEFFLNTLKCVQTFDCFNVLGHLDYICRYGPYEDKSVNHKLYQDIIDDIFTCLIKKGKGIEINTSGYRTNKDSGFPNFQQAKRYFELGGRIITIGSDSHTKDRIGENVDDVIKNLEIIGFEDVSTFTNQINDNNSNK